MTPEDDWRDFAPGRDAQPGVSGLGSLRMALLFGSGAIALALLVVPLVDRGGDAQVAEGPGQLDTMATGSIQRGGSYTIRRSVLQDNPNSVCIIRPNGARAGDC